MSKKRTDSARRRELKRRRLEEHGFEERSLADPAFGIKVMRINPSGGMQRTQVKWLVPEEPLFALWAVQRLRDGLLAGIEHDAVDGLREEGFSWAEIGRALRITGEAARLRYGRGAPDA